MFNMCIHAAAYGAAGGGGEETPLIVFLDNFTNDTASPVSITEHDPDVNWAGGGWSLLGNTSGTHVVNTLDYFDYDEQSLAIKDIGVATCTIESVYSAGTRNRDHVVIFRYVDDSNYFAVVSISDGADLYIIEVTAGTPTVRAQNISVSPNLWDSVWIQDDGERISVGTNSSGGEVIGYDSTDKFGGTIIGYSGMALGAATGALRPDKLTAISVADYTQLP